MGWDAEKAEADSWSESVWPIRSEEEDDSDRTEEGQIGQTSVKREAQRRLLQERIRWAEANLKEAREKLAKLNRPEEPWEGPDATPVITFRYRFHGSDRVYTFAGVRANSWWYLTGTSTQRIGRTWNEFMDWIETHGTLVGCIRHAIEFRELD